MPRPTRQRIEKPGKKKDRLVKEADPGAGGGGGSERVRKEQEEQAQRETEQRPVAGGTKAGGTAPVSTPKQEEPKRQVVKPETPSVQTPREADKPDTSIGGGKQTTPPAPEPYNPADALAETALQVPEQPKQPEVVPISGTNADREEIAREAEQDMLAAEALTPTQQRQADKQQLEEEQTALREQYRELNDRVNWGKIGKDYTTEDIQRLAEMEEQIGTLQEQIDGFDKNVEWDGRDALAEEYNQLWWLAHDGLATPEQEARLDELGQELAAGDAAAGNEEQFYNYGERNEAVLRSGLSGTAGAIGNAAITTADALLQAGILAPDARQFTTIDPNWQEEAQAKADAVHDFFGSAYDKVDELSESAAKDLEKAKGGLSEFGKGAVDAVNSMIGMGVDAALAPLTGGSSLAAMFARTYGAAAKEARDNGADIFEQMAYGLTDAGIEVFTEKLGDGLAGLYGPGVSDKLVDSLIDQLTDSTAGRALMNMAASAIAEGNEEVLSDLLHPFAERIYNDDAIKDLLENGYDEASLWYDFLIGAAIGSLGGTVETAMDASGSDAQGGISPEDALADTALNAQNQPGDRRVLGVKPGMEITEEADGGDGRPFNPAETLAETVTGTPAQGRPGIRQAPGMEIGQEADGGEGRPFTPVDAPAEEEIAPTEKSPAEVLADMGVPPEDAEAVLAALAAESAPQAAGEAQGEDGAEIPGEAPESATGESQEFNTQEQPTAQPKANAKAAAASLAASMGISDRGGAIASGLQGIADYIQSNNNGEGISEEGLQSKAQAVAAQMIDMVEGPETGDSTVYNGIKDLLRGRGLEISDELRGDVADYNAWRKSLFGKLSLVADGEAIDSIYAELQSEFGEGLFPADITAHSDMVNRIVEVLDGTRPQANTWADTASQQDYDAALAEMTQKVLDAADGIESGETALSGENLESLGEEAPPLEIGGTPVVESTVTPAGETVERGFARNVRTTESTEDALAKSLGEDKVTYERLLNKDVLAKAQSVYDQGFDHAKSYLDGAVAAAKSGAKLPPEAVPLARMVANEMARNGDVVGAEHLIADVAAELTQAGQLGQVGRILRQSIKTPEGKLYAMQQTVAKINEKADGKYTVELPQDLVDEYNAAETNEQRDEVIAQMQKAVAEQVPASWMEKWNALRYTAMLGNFKTQTRNVGGNLVSMVGRMAKDRVAAVMEYIGYIASGGEMERTKSVLYDPKLFGEAWNDFQNVQDEALGEGKYSDYQKQLGKGIEENRRIFNSRILEGWRRATNWAMEQGDVIFSRTNYADAMGQWLAAHKIKSISDCTPEQLERARAYAIQQAQEATFRDSNDFSDTISRIGRNDAKTTTGRVLQAIGEGIMPFRKTPANILVRAEEYSPLGVINTIADAAKAMQGKDGVTASDVIDQAAKTLTGTGFVILGYMLAASGALRGKDDDKDQENFDKLRGEQDWSLTVDGTSYTMDWVSPYSIPLFMGAQLQGLANEDGLSMGDVLNTLTAIGEPMLDMSMLDGLNDAFEVVQSYNEDTPPIALLAMNSLAGLLTQAAPTLLGQIERYGEDYRHSTYTDPNGTLPTSLQRKISQTMAKIPGFEALGIPDLDYQQQDYIDAWGRKQETPQGAQKVWETFFSPYYSSADRSTPVDDELQRLYDSGADGTDKVFPSYATRNPGGDIGRLTAEEYDTYATVRGQTSLALVQDFIESDEYKGMKDEERAEIIQNLYKLANNSAKTAVMRQREEDYGKSDPITALLDTGMDAGEAGSFVMKVSGGDGEIKQAELKDYYAAHPDEEDVIAAIWDTMGFTGKNTATWELYKGSLKGK